MPESSATPVAAPPRRNRGTTVARRLMTRAALAIAVAVATGLGGPVASAAAQDTPDREARVAEARRVAASLVTGDESLDAAVLARLPRWFAYVPPEDRRWEIDAERRLILTSTLDDDAHARFRRETFAVVDAAAAALGAGPPAEPVLVAVVEGPLASRLIAPAAEVGGRYDHEQRVLVCREIGVSLRHELVHAVHWSDMQRRGLSEPHALWIQEALAALFETWTPTTDGSTDGATEAWSIATSDRDELARKLGERRRTTPLDEFAAMDQRTFVRGAARNYAQARAVARWVHDRGVLRTWYDALDDVNGDPGGTTALANALGLGTGELDAAFRAWLAETEPAPVTIERGGPWIGVERLETADAAGVRVVRLARGAPARDAGLRARDVIRALDGRPTPTEAELDRLTASYRPGDVVRLTVARRGEEAELELEVTLGRYGEPAARRPRR